ncbi:MAG: purine-nucleoside phosphorylase [Actinomycetota bacterium]|jgi:purine-nucleoside phosphorylase|nr:purine-nucleoside phosphorylase [Actinomycetota bacterium]
MRLPQGDVAVALGSGLSGLAASLVGGTPIPYSELDGFPVSAVEGHQGALYTGEIGSSKVLLFAGRVHLYEGYDAKTVTRWVRDAIDAGCQTIVLTNAAGGIRDDLDVGAPCLISDHINLTGTNPLIGPNDDSLGPRFPDMTDAYSPALRKLAREVDPGLKEGVYAGFIGPSYETPAEVQMAKAMGADLVGMSTVLEAIAARHRGAQVLGISVVTNMAAGISKTPLSHDEVATSAKAAAARLEKLLSGVLERL